MMGYSYLSYEQQNILVEKSLSGDEAATLALIDFLMPFANKIAWRFINPGVDLEDLLQEATCAILMAIPRYRPDLNSKFSSYCYFWMVKRIQNYAVPATRISGVNAYIDYIYSYIHQFEEVPDDETIKAELNISDETLNTYKYVVKPNILFDHTRSELESPSGVDVDEIINKIILEGALGCLTEQEQHIVISYWGLFSTPRRSYREIGLRYDRSGEWVRRIENEARNTMRIYLSNAGVKLDL